MISRYIVLAFMSVHLMVGLFASFTTTFSGRVKETVSPYEYYDGQYDTYVEIGYFEVPSDDSTFVQLWDEVFEDDEAIAYTRGFFSIELGASESNPLTTDVFNQDSLFYRLHISDLTFDFPLTSLPYAIRSGYAERVNNAYAETLIEGTHFAGVTTNKGLVVGDAFEANHVLNKVGIGKSVNKESYKLDIEGSLNASMLYVDGEPLVDTFQWQSSSDDPANIFNTTKRIFVGSFGSFVDNRFDVIVSGALNADYIYQDEGRLTAALDWIEDTDQNIIYVEDKRVGLGTISPEDALDVLGGISIGNRDDLESDLEPGIIAFDGSDFIGYTGEEWRSLTGVRGSGFANNTVIWTGANNLSYGESSFFFDEDSLRFGVNTNSPDAQFTVLPEDDETALLYVHTPSSDVVYISPSGNIGIGTRLVRDDAFITVSGNFNVISDDETGGYYLNGLPLRFTLLSGTYFKKHTDYTYIYLDKNYLAIGVPDLNEDLPSNYVNVEIASPPILATDDEVTKDAALTFSYDADTDDDDIIYYTMGVDADSEGIFRVENSASLGNDFPLFVLQEDRIGLGVERPDANLHVSGNLGLIVSGQLDDSTANISITGNIFTFVPRRAALIAGNISESFLNYAFDSVLDEKVSVNIGETSVLIGNDSLATGVRSTALGGYRNIVEGAYSSALGGSNNIIKGYWSLALGERSYVTDHGGFVWSDVNVSNSTANFTSIERNQFLIEAVNGVGINTSETTGTALTVQMKRLYPYDFITLSSTESFDTADDIYSELVSVGLITSEGYLAGLHPHFNINDLIFVGTVSFIVSTSDVYDVLVNGSYPLDETSFTQSVTPVVSDTSHATWAALNRAIYSKELWQALVTDNYINDQGEFRDFVANNSSQFDAKYASWININDLADVLTAYYDDDELVGIDIFEDYILPTLLDEEAFEVWIEEVAVEEASNYVWLDLINRRYLTSSGEAARAYVDFDQSFTTTVFNGEEIPTENVLSFLYDEYDRLLIKTTGVKGVTGLTVQNSNKVGIGYASIDTAALAVSGSVGINTNSPSSLLHISNDGDGSSENIYSFLIDAPDISPTPALSVTTKGLVGVGQWNPLRDEELLDDVSGDIALTVGQGGIYAANFTLPTGQSLTVSDPVIVWTENGYDIYYVSSNVGIGTLLPGSLLELSNADNKDPVITFDLDAVDYFSLGIDQDDRGKFKVQSQGVLDKSGIGLMLNGSAVGVNTDVPKGALTINGSTIVNTINFSDEAVISDEESRLDVYGLKTDSFYLNGEYMSASGTKWVSKPEKIYFTASGSNVGIGTTSPSELLDVSGNIYGDIIYIRNNLTAEDSLVLDALTFSSDEGELNLYVVDSELVAESSSLTLNISDTLTRGEGSGGSLVVWESDTVINESPMTYESEEVNGSYPPLWKYDDLSDQWYINDEFDPTLAGVWSVTFNMAVSREAEQGNINISNDIVMGKSDLNAFSTVTQLNYDNKFFTDSQSFEASSIVINFSDIFESTGTVRGVNVVLDSELTSENIDASLTKEAHAYGVYTDVTGIQVQEQGPSVRGFKYPALFMGDVGIGVDPIRPSPDVGNTVLAVNGTLKAVSFNISERLTISTIDVQTQVFHIGEDENVGININQPTERLAINGGLRTSTLNVSTGINTGTLSVQSNNFIVDSTGFVGIGITERAGFDGHTYLFKTIDAQLEDDFVFKKFESTLDEDFSENMTGLLLDFQSYSASNSLGPDQFIHGVEVDTTALAVEDGSVIVGMDIAVPTNTYSAVLLGGNVGIGTSEPQATLHVAGTLYATNFPSIGLSTEQHGGEFSYLSVIDSVHLGVSGVTTMNNLWVETLDMDSIDFSGTVSLNVLLHVSDFVAGDYSVASTVTASQLISTQRLTVDEGVFDTLTIGDSSLTEGVVVDGDVNADNVFVSDDVNAARLSVNTNQLLVNSSGYVGIGTSTPYNKLSVQMSPSLTFSANNNRSWNAIRLQSDTSVEDGAVGVLMNVESFTEEDETPVGILALRADATTATGSTLVLVGNESSIWILSSGNVGIGTSEPDEIVHVAGNGRVVSNLTIGTDLNSARVSGDTIAIQSPVFSTATVNVSTIGSDTSVILKKSDENDILDGYLQLYVSDDDKLIFKTMVSNGDIVTASVSEVLLGDELLTIPYYDENHKLSSMPMQWLTGTTSTFLIGSDDTVKSVFNDTAVVNHFSTIVASVNSEQVLKSLSLQIPRRDTSSSYVFSGLDIRSNSDDLAEEDTVVGLSVNVSDLYATSNIVIEDDVLLTTEGTKIAALLRGGRVGIFENPDGSTQPSSSVHIQSYAGEDAFRVTGVDESIIVKNSGYVGIGTTRPNALIHVAGDDDVLVTLSSGDNRAVEISQTSVLIGDVEGSESLAIGGDLTASEVVLGGLESADVDFNSGGFVLSDSGKIGLQTTDPTAFFETQKVFSTPLASAFSQQSISLVVDTVITKDITGISFAFSSTQNNKLSSEGSAVGLNIDLTALEKEPEALVRGLVLSVSENMDETLTAAQLMGGYVGIGTTEPSTALDVAGSIQGRHFLYSGDPQNIQTSGSATVNTLFTSGDYTGNTLEISSNGHVLIRDLTFTQQSSAFDITGADFENIIFTVLHRLDADSIIIPTASIGTDNSVVALTLDGNVQVSGEITEIDQISLTSITSNAALVINAVTVNMDEALIASNDMNMSYVNLSRRSQSGLTFTENDGVLFVNEDENDDLYYITLDGEGDPISANLTTLVSGAPLTVPYFDDNGLLSVGSYMLWQSHPLSVGDDAYVFRIGTANESFTFNDMALSQIQSLVSDTETSSPIAQTIQLSMAPRLSASSSVFNGLKVVGDMVAATELYEDDIFIGVNIDLSQLESNYSQIVEGQVTQFENGMYAAVFRGGFVGVAINDASDTFVPSVNLHIQSLESQDGLRVVSHDDNDVTRDALIVKNSGHVGIGTTTPSTQLSIKGIAQQPIVSVVTAENNDALYIDNEGVAIGTDTVSEALSVEGELQGDDIVSDGLISNEIEINSSVFVVNSEQKIGINASTLDANFNVQKTFSGALSSPYSQQRLEQVLNTVVTKDITGLGIAIQSESNNSLGVNGSAVGLNIDMTTLVKENTSRIVGVSSLVSDNMDESLRSALLLGGNVGIGTTLPETTLDINGEVKGRHLLSSGDLFTLPSLNSVTVNTLYVDETLSGGTLNVQNEAVIVDSLTFTNQNNVFQFDMNDIQNLQFSVLQRLDSDLIVINTMNIGTDTSEEEVTISGNVIISESLAVASGVSVSAIEATPNLVINAIELSSESEMVFSGELFSIETLKLTPLSDTLITGIDEYGQLYVSSNDDNLYYVIGENGDTTTSNLTGIVSGVATSLLYLDGLGNVASDVDLQWVNTALDSGDMTILRVGTDNSGVVLNNESLVQLMSYVGEEETGDLVHESIQLTIGKRITAGDSVFTGVNVLGGADQLIAEDVFVGASVSLIELKRGYSQDVEGEVTVFDNDVYAALFRGGRVGIGINQDNTAFAPSSNVAVHVRSNDGEDGLIVSPNGSESVSLIVKNRGLVGIGTVSPEAKLSVVGNGEAQVSVLTEAGVGLVVSENVGIGTVTPSKELEIVGNLRGNNAVFGELEASTANVGGGVFVVTEAGQVGFNTDSPEADFHAYKSIGSALSARYVEELISVDVRETNNVYLSGIELAMESVTNNELQSGQRAVGLDIDLSELEIREGSVGLGLQAQVASGMYAGIFEGGFVGIGTTEPNVALDIVGSIKGSHFEYSSTLGDLGDIEDVTINTLSVLQGAEFGEFTIDLSHISTLSVTSTLTFDTLISSLNISEEALSSSTLNITSSVFSTIATMNYVVVNTDNIAASLNVVGDAMVTGSIFMSASSTVNVDSIYASEGLLIDANLQSESPIELMDGYTLFAQSLRLEPSSVLLVSDTSYGQVFSNELDNDDLYYLITDGSDVRTENISGLGRGTPTSLLYFNGLGNVASDVDLQWVNTALDSGEMTILRVGTDNSGVVLNNESLVHVMSYVGEEETGDLVHESIQLTIGKRITAGDSVFTGVNVLGGADQLIAEDVFVGASVSLIELKRGYSQDIEGEVTVFDNDVYAALFRGGRVGIGINQDDTDFAPSSNVAVHVRSNDGEDGLIVSPNGSESVSLIVKNRGVVGIGTVSPEAKLSVVGNGEAQVSVLTEAGVGLVVSENVGIGTVTPSKELEIVGRLSGNNAVFGELEASTANVGGGVFVVTEAGQVGFNTDAPEADFHAYKSIGSALSARYVEELISVDVRATNNVYLSGIELLMNADTNNSLQSGQRAVGLDIDLSELEIREGSVGLGIQAQVASGMYAGIFEGGFVGIGTTEPNVAFDIVGSIKGSHFEYSSTLGDLGDIEDVTINTLSVLQGAEFGEFTIDLSHISTLSVTSTLTFDTLISSLNISEEALSSPTLNITSSVFSTIATMNYVVVNTDNIAASLNVVGDAMVTGSILMSASSTVNIDSIYASEGLLIDANLQSESPIELMDGYTLFAQSLRLEPSSVLPVSDTSYAQVFSNELDNDDLYYLITDGSDVRTENISGLGRGTPTSLLYLDGLGNVASDVDLQWENTALDSGEMTILRVGTDNSGVVLNNESLVHLMSYVGEEETGDLVHESIQLTIGKRITAGDSVFTGVNVLGGADQLIAEDVFVGVSVSLNGLERGYSQDIEGEVTIFDNDVYAALFRGGRVGIGINQDNTDFEPSSNVAVHVRSNDGEDGLIVSANGSESVSLIVKNRGLVGIGTVSPEAKLSVVGNGEAQVSVLTEAGVGLVVSENVGIGTVTPSKALEIVGRLSGNNAVFGELEASTANVGGGVFVVTEAGQVGFNTDAPEADFHAYKSIGSALSARYVEELISVNVRATNNVYLSGIELLMNADTNNTLQSGQRAVGLDIDLSELEIREGSVGLGIQAQVASGMYAGIFEGGFVGIGTTEPNVALDIVGSLRSTYFSYSDPQSPSSLGDLESLSVNEFYVDGATQFGEFDVNALGQRIIVNDLTFTNQTTSINFTVDVGQTSHLVLGNSALATSATINVISVNGASTANVVLGVEGDGLIYDTLYLNGASTITVNSIIAEQDVYFHNDVTINSQLDIIGNNSVHAYYYQLEPLDKASIVPSSTYGQLFVDTTDKKLYYVIVSDAITITANIASLESGENNQIPYLGTSRTIKTDGLMSLIPSNPVPGSTSSSVQDMFIIGTANTTTSTGEYSVSNIISYVSSQDSFEEPLSAIDIQFLIPRRITGSDSDFYGLNIKMDAERPVTKDVYVGLNVSMNIEAESTTERALAEDSLLKGYKVAGVFMGGAVGISATNDASIMYPTANVVINNKTNDDIPLLVSSNVDGSPYLVFNASGNITLGVTTNNGIKLKMVGVAEYPEVAMYDNTNASVFTVENGFVSLFSDESNVASLYVNASGLPSVFRVDAASQDNALHIDDAGFVGVHTDNPSAELHVVSNANDAFSVNSSTKTGLFVSGNNVLMGTDSLSIPNNYMSLVVDQILATGLSSTSLLPSFMNLDATSSTFNGIVGSYGPLMYGMGVMSHSSTDNAQLIYGGTSSQNSLVVQGYSKVKGGDFDMLVFDGNANVGVHQFNPQANFHLSGYNAEDYLLIEPSANNKNSFFIIDDQENIGVNTRTPEYSMDVSGDAKFGSVIDAPINGTVLNVPSLVVTSKSATGNNATMHYVQTRGDVGHTMYENTVSLERDHWHDVVGIDIVVSSNGTKKLQNDGKTDVNAYGVFVDMTDLIVNDATFGDEVGKLYAATFFSATDAGTLDTFVGIGTSTPNASLEVQAFTFNSVGVPLYEPTGNIAYFQSTPNKLDGVPTNNGSGFLIFGNNTITSDIKYNYYTDTVAPIVPTAALMAIVYEQESQVGTVTTIYVDWATAVYIMDELTDSVVSADGTLASDWEANLAPYYAQDLGYAIPSTNVRDILMNFDRRAVIGLSVFDLDTNVSYNPIVLATGFTGKPEENTFVGSVGINMYDSFYAYPEYNLNEALSVSGDIRLGTVKAVTGQRDAPGGEPAFYFSGGPELYPDEEKDSENEDELFMQRRNYDLNITQLMVVVGDDNRTRADARFSVGATVADGSNILLDVSVSSGDYGLATANVTYDEAEAFIVGWYEYISSANYDPASVYTEYYTALVASQLTFPYENAGSEFGDALAALNESYNFARGELLGNPSSPKVFEHALTVRAFAHDGDNNQYEETGGYVGIGTSEPEVPLHVVGSHMATSEPPSPGAHDYLVEFDNASEASNINTLMINYSATIPYSDSNFITFLVHNSSNDEVLDSLGSIEGNDNGDGVQFVSPERDYAEYIPKRDESELIEAGDVVGIFQGQLSKQTDGADQVMVISSSPIVIGNWPGKNEEHKFGLVAFLGQVPVTVQGPVNEGDYIVASGKSDGTAIALSSDELTTEFIDAIVGRALESSDETGLVKVNTIIGFPFGQSQIERNISQLRTDVKSVKHENDELEQLLKERLEKRRKLIDQLKSDMVSR